MFILVLYRTISMLISIYSWILLAYALMSWMPNLYQTAIGRLIIKISRPYISIFERLPLKFGMLDLSVLAALLSLQFLSWLLGRALMLLLSY